MWEWMYVNSKGLFSLLPAPSGTHNHTQIYNAVNTTFLETKWNRGASNRCFSNAALSSFLGKYLRNLAIFHNMSNSDVCTTLLRAHKRTVFLAKFLFKKQIHFSLCIFCQRKVDYSTTNQALRTNNHKGILLVQLSANLLQKKRNFFEFSSFHTF